MSVAFRIGIVAGVVGVALSAGLLFASRAPNDTTELVMLPPTEFAYRASGEFLEEGHAVNPPMITVSFARPLAIMRDHVSRRDYQRCVTAHACKSIDAGTPANADRLPAVGVNWADAMAYATWLSRETGHRYRLPSDAEWAYAAGALFHDATVVATGDAGNPAARWIATYESQSAAPRIDESRPQPFGTYGINEHGLADIAGNVWDWTATCFSRRSTSTGRPAVETESCGVRVVEGAHRAYLTDFIRNPKGGACSVGTPPANLGIRLVRDDDLGLIARLVSVLRKPVGGS